MRIWSNRGDEQGSIHVLGNGRLVAYGRGPDLPYLYGPPYSSPVILSLATVCADPLRDEAAREPGSAIWSHRLSIRDAEVLRYIEFVAAEMPAYVRLFSGSGAGLHWTLQAHQAAEIVPCADPAGAWLLILRPGQRIFNYPANNWSFHWVIPSGTCRVEHSADHELAVRCLPGEGSLAIVGASEYPLGRECAAQIAQEGAAALLRGTQRYWQAFTGRRLATQRTPPTSDRRTLAALDSVAVLIAAQCSLDGGVMAGHYYPLAYIRDQYGTARGMLALGMVEEARANLEFRRRKWERFGTLQTAETMGTDCARHIHEDDQVEGPGYTILQARDYLAATGDRATLRSCWPMLEWCWQVQLAHLVGGLLPFNGDETYVAGGFFPRSGLLHGSADATLVFIAAGRWLAQWAQAEGLWSTEQAAGQFAAVAAARAAYRRAFLDGGILYANAPERERLAPPPFARHGVCEGRCGWFGWTERSAQGRYLCPRCLAGAEVPAEVPPRMEVNSVGLLPAYLGSDILAPQETRPILDRILGQQQPSGHIPTVPGTAGCVGYDPGLILGALTATNHPAAPRAFERVLRLMDDSGAWVEYYDADDRPRAGCCRCRPWESGINAEAVIRYLSAPAGSRPLEA